MLKKDRWRLILVAVVVVAALLSVFPVKGRVRLGLDLKGGAHILLQAKGTAENPLTEDSVERLLAVLRNRIDQYGVSEPLIQREGSDRVIVDLPGVADPEAALELIGKTALLEFRHVYEATGSVPPGPQRGNYDSQKEFLAAKARWDEVNRQFDAVAEGMRARAENDPGMMMARSEEGEAYLLGKVYVSGRDLVDAKTSFDNLGRPVVTLQFSNQGSRLFDAATASNVGKQIAICLDGNVISAPVVQERISSGNAQISGRFSTAVAQRLAIMLRAGALPVGVEILENRSVGPTLGSDSIRSGLRAGLLGALLVLLFMLVYYRTLGIAANIALSVSMLLVFAGLISLKATLTLPGIAGIVLTLGMAVDGNILIFERMKEEVAGGKTPYAAVDAGFRKALSAILDANITTLLAAAVLFYFGSGPIRGFAVTLSIGIVASVFSALVVTRALLHLLQSGSRGRIKIVASDERGQR
ncbi:MAG: protein translocase subunit SecD [Thermovirgaceae bacterium]|nr:protein translocase subunit SecD [Thermovirgaceae bacterium]